MVKVHICHTGLFVKNCFPICKILLKMKWAASLLRFLFRNYSDAENWCLPVDYNKG